MISRGFWAATVWEHSPESRWRQRRDNVLIVDNSVNILDVFVIPDSCCRVEDSWRSTSDNLYICLHHIRITYCQCLVQESALWVQRRKHKQQLVVRSRQLTLGNVAFAHGPHIVARAAPRLNPAQSTLHSCCSIKAAEPLPAETLAGRHATCMHRCIRKKWPQMAH